MPVVADRLSADGYTEREILALFKKAQKALIDTIANSTNSYAISRSAQLRAIEVIISQLERDIASWTAKKIPFYINAGSKEIADAVKALHDPGFGFSFSGVNKEAVKVLTQGAGLEFGNTVQALRRGTMKAFIDKRKLQTEIVSSVIQGNSVYKTQQELITGLRSKGIELFKANNGLGRRFNVEDYTNMLVRTQVMNAYNIGARTTLLRGGRKFVKVPTLRPDLDGPDICNDYEKKKYLDLDNDKMPPWHPRCRHFIQPVSFAELQRERPDLYEQAVAFYQEKAQA